MGNRRAADLCRLTTGAPAHGRGAASADRRLSTVYPCGVAQPVGAVAMLTAMTIQRMDNVGIVVDDLDAATAFFVELGLELEGRATVEGPSVDRLVGLDGVR